MNLQSVIVFRVTNLVLLVMLVFAVSCAKKKAASPEAQAQQSPPGNVAEGQAQKPPPVDAETQAASRRRTRRRPGTSNASRGRFRFHCNLNATPAILARW